MVKVVRSFPAPKSLAEEAKKATGKYDKQDVIERLKNDFHNKCYICEIKEHIGRENSIGKIFFGLVDIAMLLKTMENMMREL